MISDKWLLALSFFCFFLGIFFMVHIIPDVSHTALYDLKSKVGQKVIVTSQVNTFRISNGHLFLSLGKKNFPVVMFYPQLSKTPLAATLKHGDLIEVTGEVTLYKNSLEIIAEDINLVG